MERVKVFMLMAGLTALLVVIGGLINGTSGAMLFFVIAAVMNVGMYWFSDKVVLRMYKAKVIERQDAPELYDMVDRLRQRAGLPMPVSRDRALGAAQCICHGAQSESFGRVLHRRHPEAREQG